MIWDVCLTVKWRFNYSLQGSQNKRCEPHGGDCGWADAHPNHIVNPSNFTHLHIDITSGHTLTRKRCCESCMKPKQTWLFHMCCGHHGHPRCKNWEMVVWYHPLFEFDYNWNCRPRHYVYDFMVDQLMIDFKFGSTKIAPKLSTKRKLKWDRL